MPEEICDGILAYFNVQDIKETSIVSKQWYNTIGRSKSCMKKLYLKPKESHQNHEFFKSILDSNRMYQNLEMVDRYNEVKKNTKYLRLMRDVVTKLAPTLVNLKISSDLIIKIDLPKLKVLEFDARGFKILIAINGLLTKTKGLDKLTVDCENIDQKSIKYLRIFLMENESLKVLNIDDNRLFQGLNATNIKFRLDEFYTDYRPPIPFDFFKVHSDSLKVTKTTLARDSIKFFMTNFSQLHTLTIEINCLHPSSPFDIPFNTTIRKLKLDIYFYYIRNGDIYIGLYIIELIKKVQNLEEVEMDFINSGILHALFNCRSLKTVKLPEDYLTRQDYDEMELHEHINFDMF